MANLFLITIFTHKMEVNYNLISIIDILGLTQGIILGSLLLFIDKRKEKSTRFLGLFIITYALELVPAIFEDLNILLYYPQCNLLFFGIIWLIFPLFFIYIQEVSIFSKSKTSYKTLIPGLLFFTIGLFLMLLNPESKVEFKNSIWYLIVTFLGFIYSIIIGIIILKYISSHLNELRNQYSTTDYKALHWARNFVLIGVIHTLIVLSSAFFEPNYYFLLTISTINIALLYWISVKGILQQNIHALIPTDRITKLIKQNKPPTTKSNTLLNEDIKSLLIKLELYIKQEKVYTKPDLTIIDIADHLKEHPKRVSNIINTHLNQNFNSYVNSFRISKAKQLLKSDLVKNFSIEGIGTQVGFQNKSTFYDAFKKSTNTTPLKYKNQ